MLSKLNYFKHKEERNVYENHFVRSYEIEFSTLAAICLIFTDKRS